MKFKEFINPNYTKIPKVFLGGTCNESTWRNELIKLLKVGYFNPVVDDWTEEHKKEELLHRKECDYVLYVITPKMTGVYSIAELIDDSNKQPHKTLICVLSTDDKQSFDKAQLKSLEAVKELANANGAIILNSLNEIADYLNKETTDV